MVAADRGDPPLWAEVDVELDVVDRNNKPPLWDLTNYGPIFVKENVTVGTVVTSVKARSVSRRVLLLLFFVVVPLLPSLMTISEFCESPNHFGRSCAFSCFDLVC